MNDSLQTPSLDLVEFVEQQILPRYNAFDRAHDIGHANRVIANSMELAKRTGADLNMVYAIAAYHDLGLEGPRAIHHLTSGRILQADARLRKWFSADQIKVMREAVEDHRASSSHAPRSLYGRIVAEADRELEPEMVFRRTIEYGLDHYPELSEEEQWKRFVAHIENKYAHQGYIHLWVPGSKNEQYLASLRHIVETPDLLRSYFDRLFHEEKGDGLNRIL